MTTIGSATSRVRNIIKAVKEDPFLTDRFIYALIIKYAKFYIKREDDRGRILRISSLFTKLSCVELIETNKIDACCGGLESDCTIMRTKDKLPEIIEGYFGPMFRTITSIDGSVEFYITEPGTYLSMTKSTNFKYNKNKYFWFMNGHLFFPNVIWEAVSVEGLFTGDVGEIVCDSDPCLPRQEQNLPIPDYLFVEIEEGIKRDMGFTIQVPSDTDDDKENAQR